MKTYMIWIPGKIVGMWNNSTEALKGFREYVELNEANLTSIKMTIYEPTHEYGAKVETMLTGQELMDIVNEENKH